MSIIAVDFKLCNPPFITTPPTSVFSTFPHRGMSLLSEVYIFPLSPIFFEFFADRQKQLYRYVDNLLHIKAYHSISEIRHPYTLNVPLQPDMSTL